MKTILLESQYFPSLAYISEIAKADLVIINDKELFNKQSYRNRSSIRGANGKLDLIVPVSHSSTRKIKGLEISYIDRWNSIHSKSIESAYRKSPFYDYYSDEILAPLQKQHDKLLDLNMDILTIVLELLEIETPIKFLSDFSKEETPTYEDLTEAIHPKRSKISYNHPTYQQVFEGKHLQNLSILDAIFCVGNETNLLLDNHQRV